RRGRIEVEVVLLHVFAVVSFVAGEAEEPFFEDGIAAIPQCDSEADVLMAIANTAEAIFAPAVGTRAGGIVGKVFPRGAVWTVVLADRRPLAFAQVGSPALPVRAALA